MKKIITFALLIFAVSSVAFASDVAYLPNVTKDMSNYSYWSEDSSVLMTYKDIQKQNELTVSAKETCMHNLKNQPETVNGIALNEAVLKSTEADAAYYTGWTYIESETLATMEDYSGLIQNTQNPDAKENQPVLYGIVVRTSELRTFPSSKAIWDDPKDIDLDYQYLSALRVNEPVVITSVSKDGKFYLAKSICCSGWVSAEDVALCENKEQWISSWDIEPEDALVVYGDKVYLETSITGKETSALMLTMGTVLKKADIDDPNVLIDNRAAYQNYVVWVPTRNEDGKYEPKLTLISEHAKVHSGYLPLTKENISMVAFGALGNTYGWGGSLNSDDCSGYLRNIYKCFGLELARNTSWQSVMPMAKIDMRNMCREEREAILKDIPVGSALYFNGHVLMYLGSENANYYVISSVGSIMQPGNDSVRQRIRSIVINTLEVKRANGNTWLDELTDVVVPFLSVGDETLPEYMWYHDGVKYCVSGGIMQNDADKRFNPTSHVSVEEVFGALWIKEGRPGLQEGEDYSYEKVLSWVKSQNLIPQNITVFDNPEANTAREDIIFVMYSYISSKGIDTKKHTDTDLGKFVDADVASYAVDAVKYAVGEGLIVGKTPTTLNPKDIATRAEAATLLHRFLNL